MNIRINDYRVIESGSVVTHSDKSILFELEGLNINVVFNTDREQTGLPVNFSLINNKTIEIKLTNFNSIGAAIEEPIKIGRINGLPLYMQFMISSLNETGTKVFHYSFLLKNE